MNESKRPVLVWIISIVILIMGLWSAGLFFYTTAQNLMHGIQNIFGGMSVQAILSILGLSILNIVAAINLLRLKKTALYLFSASFGGSVLLTLTTLISASGRRAFFGIGFMGAIVNWAIFALICFYCYSLKKKQILT